MESHFYQHGALAGAVPADPRIRRSPVAEKFGAIEPPVRFIGPGEDMREVAPSQYSLRSEPAHVSTTEPLLAVISKRLDELDSLSAEVAGAAAHATASIVGDPHYPDEQPMPEPSCWALAALVRIHRVEQRLRAALRNAERLRDSL